MLTENKKVTTIGNEFTYSNILLHERLNFQLQLKNYSSVTNIETAT